MPLADGHSLVSAQRGAIYIKTDVIVAGHINLPHSIVVHQSVLFCSRQVTEQCWPGSVAGIATDYGLEGPGIQSRWGRDFPHQSKPALGPAQLSMQWVPGFSLG